MKSMVEFITPDLAKQYLDTMGINRRLQMPRVKMLVRNMERGTWQDNGASIVFNRSGRLVDGQHRLQAIIQSGIAQELVVVRDVDDAVTVFDLGKNRSIPDILRAGGMPVELANPTNVAIAKLHFMLNGAMITSSDEIEIFIENHASSLLAIRKIWTVGGHKDSSLLSTKSAAFLLAILCALESGEDINKLTRFASVYRTGLANNEFESAAVVCRNDCLARRINPYHGGESDRTKSEMVFEKAIYDFCRKYPRKQSYKDVSEHTYTIPKWEQIKEDLS